MTQFIYSLSSRQFNGFICPPDLIVPTATLPRPAKWKWQRTRKSDLHLESRNAPSSHWSSYKSNLISLTHNRLCASYTTPARRFAETIQWTHVAVISFKPSQTKPAIAELARFPSVSHELYRMTNKFPIQCQVVESFFPQCILHWK